MKPTIEQIPTLSYEELVEQLRLSRINGADYRDISRALNAEMRLRTPSSQYRCFKCGHTSCELIQVRTSGGFFSAAFNLQNQRFTAAVCVRCKFTEFYHGKASGFQQVADVLIGG